MKNRFIKTTLTLLIISMIPVLSGFCIFQLSPNNSGVSMAQAATIDNVANTVSNEFNTCEDEQPTENDSNQPLPAPANHNQNSLLACCIDGRHNGVASIIQSVESGLSTPVAFFPQYHLEIPSPRITYIYNPDIYPLALVLIKTTVLRL